MKILDCLSTCLGETKVFRFNEEDFPEGIELISQTHPDCLQSMMDSKQVVDSLKSDAMSKLHFKERFRFSKPFFFGEGNFSLLYYPWFIENSGYVILDKKSGKLEHSYSIKIESLDNPGRGLKIDIANTPIESLLIPYALEEKINK